MFLYNLQYRWEITSGSPHGAILHAAGCSRDQAESRTFPSTQRNFVLFDPNSYLWQLDFGTAEKTGERLESYPWTPGEVGRQQPASLDDAEVAGRISSAVQWQLERGCSRAILPTPPISDPVEGIDEFLRWVDIGTRVAKDFDIPCLVTLTMSDVAIKSQLEAVLDQVTSRKDLPGLYLMADTSGASGTGAIGSDVARMLLLCSFLVGHRMEREVFVNYADSFGLACMAVGASGFGSGYEQKARRLDLDGYAPRDGGGAFPRFFALATTAYYRSRMDLERIRDARLLRLLEADVTTASESLFAALKSGASADRVPEWREARNNVSAARQQLVLRLTSAAEQLDALPSVEARAESVLRWLQGAERDSLYLKARLEDSPLDDDGRHVGAWRAEFERFAAGVGLA